MQSIFMIFHLIRFDVEQSGASAYKYVYIVYKEIHSQIIRWFGHVERARIHLADEKRRRVGERHTPVECGTYIVYIELKCFAL